MARPVKLTEGMRKKIIKQFADHISQIKYPESKCEYTQSFVYKEQPKATIVLTPLAYRKMTALLEAFDTEIAWHGIGERTGLNTFKITDIVVYPQKVTVATVEMDTEKYALWLQENDEDERFSHIVMQGHSHVKMATSPSGTDREHQFNIVKQLTDNMFYIFTIWNKRHDKYTIIYDMENNVVYDNSDIEYVVERDNDVEEFVKDAKSKVIDENRAAYLRAMAREVWDEDYGIDNFYKEWK